jgi:hypothetical protein
MSEREAEAGRAMDAEIARRVFGLNVAVEETPTHGREQGEWFVVDDGRSVPRYSARIDAAWQVVAHLMERGMAYSFGSGSWPDGTRYHVARFFRQDLSLSRAYLGDAPSPPLAICRAALRWADGREAVRTGDEGGE